MVHYRAAVCNSVQIMSCAAHTTTPKKHLSTFLADRFVLRFLFFTFAAMATTVRLRTLISKSAQWVVIRLWDYPIHTEKSNGPGPNHIGGKRERERETPTNGNLVNAPVNL